MLRNVLLLLLKSEAIQRGPFVTCPNLPCGRRECQASSFDAGDYPGVSEVLNHLVFADPENVRARELLAGACDRLGCQSESGPWRDVYLTAALELRHGVPKPPRAGQCR